MTPSKLPGPEHWTYGSEHELGDWDTSLPFPAGCYRTPDHTVVNTNGIAAQPNTVVYRFGGELNTPPSSTLEEQVSILEQCLQHYKVCTVNHRSNLHLHVRIPGLKDSLPHLKLLQNYIHSQLPAVLNLLEPIPTGSIPAERKRSRRRKVSHHTFLTSHRVTHQLNAQTVKEFFEREVPQSKAGAIMWHAQPRVCVNLRQLLQTDTVEFRHFPGTINSEDLTTCLQWCRDFLQAALAEEPLSAVWVRYANCKFPTFPAFNEEREVRYQATAAKSGLTPAEISTNIQLILKGKFNALHSPTAYRKAQERAGAVPREHAS